MTSTRLLAPLRRRSGLKRIPDLKIIITDKIVIIEYPKTKADGFIAREDPRAIKIVNFVRI